MRSVMVAVVLLMPEVASAEGSVGVQYAMRDGLAGGAGTWFPNGANLRWYIDGSSAIELAMADFETGALATNDSLAAATKRSLLPITLGTIVRTRSPVYLAFGTGFARDHISYQVGHAVGNDDWISGPSCWRGYIYGGGGVGWSFRAAGGRVEVALDVRATTLARDWTPPVVAAAGTMAEVPSLGRSAMQSSLVLNSYF
jgi:hypothetical protein